MAKLSEFKRAKGISAAEAAEQISQIALGMVTGEVHIRNGGAPSLLHPGPVVNVELKGKEDKDEGKISIEISWRTHLRIQGTINH